jgi:hypothetical protein
MKKTKQIQLVLVTAAIAASCTSERKEQKKSGGNTYVRGDSTAPYTQTHTRHWGGGLGFYAFRPFYGSMGGIMSRTGYYSNGLAERSNVGSNTSKRVNSRGGFGRMNRAGG